MSSDQKPETWGFGLTIMVIVGLIALISFGAVSLAGKAKNNYAKLAIAKAAAEEKGKAAAKIDHLRVLELKKIEDMGPMPTAADIKAGAVIYNTCVGCHGPAGVGPQNAALAQALGAPNIAGMPVWYSQAQIQKIRDGIRGHDPSKSPKVAMMKPMVMALDNDKIFQVSGYLQSLKKAKPFHTLCGDAQKGKVLFGTCTSCHGNNGEGNPSKDMRAAPLNNLPDWYIVSQLRQFKSGARGTHPDDKTGATMQAQSISIKTEQDMIDIAEYIKTLDK